MRFALVVLALALPLAAAGQILHDVDGSGLWTIGGTNNAENIIIDCVGGTAKVNDTDPASGPRPCIDIVALNLVMGGGDDFAYLRVIDQFAFDPATPSSFDVGLGDDIVQLDFQGFADGIEVHIAAPPTGPPVLEASNTGGGLFNVSFPNHLLLAFEVGPGDDDIIIDLGERGEVLSRVEVYGGPGDDTVDGTGTSVPFPLLFFGDLGNDVLIAGSLNTSSVWTPGDGDDRYIGGPGHNEVEIVGGDARLGIHQIRGFLDSGCAFFDFINGGGIIDEGVDEATFFPGDGGIDLFTEIECGVPEATWVGGGGPDHSFLRGRAGGGNRLDLDFEVDTAIFADGFESGDVSSWSNTSDATAGRGGDAPWDGLDYQDWPSFGAPATSGPSTVTVRGVPDFPVTIDLGPDGGTGRGGALDSLLIDPMGLSVDDDGSRIIIGGGPPITYQGVEVVMIVEPPPPPPPPPPTADEDGPDGTPALTAFPNPSAGGTRVRLDGAVAVAVRVVVLDALGRRVAVLHDGPARAGHIWMLAAGRLAPGVYVIRAEGTAWAASRTIVVTE